MADVANNAYEGRLYAENAVIGSLLIDENAAPGILAAVNAGDIQIQQNRQIYQAARALMLDGLPVDPVLIRDKLGKNIEGHILQLMETTPTSANWREYAEVMRQQAALIRPLSDAAPTATSGRSSASCPNCSSSAAKPSPKNRASCSSPPTTSKPPPSCSATLSPI